MEITPRELEAMDNKQLLVVLRQVVQEFVASDYFRDLTAWKAEWHRQKGCND